MKVDTKKVYTIQMTESEIKELVNFVTCLDIMFGRLHGDRDNLDTFMVNNGAELGHDARTWRKKLREEGLIS